jgi:hypothetical protein
LDEPRQMNAKRQVKFLSLNKIYLSLPVDHRKNPAHSGRARPRRKEEND